MNRVAARAPIAAAIMCFFCAPAFAYNFNTGNSDLTISWNNTLKYSTVFRVRGASDKLLGYPDGGLANNLDDGDRNFDSGLVSNRFDILSEFFLRKQTGSGSYGVRVSAAGWYDTEYNKSNDNDSPETSNNVTVPYNHFTGSTRTLMGRDVELLDAYVFGAFNVAGFPVTARVGQQAIVWGQTIFFGSNGIAAAQQPVDLIQLLNVPSAEFKQIVLPTRQLFMNMQLTNRWSIAGYYQLEVRKDRLPPAGSFLSSADIIGGGSEEVVVGAPLPGAAGPLRYVRGPDIRPKNSSGQFGVKLEYSPSSYDLAFYAAQYNAKDPQLYFVDSANATPALNGVLGTLVDVYPSKIRTVAVSLSTNVGDWNLGGEVDYRWNLPLVSDPQTIAVGEVANGSNHPAYAVGRSLNADLSGLILLPASKLWGAASFVGEIGWNMRAGISHNPSALDPHTTKSAAGFQLVFTPTYFQVIPGVDLNVPLGLGYNITGRSSTVSTFNGGASPGGNASVGLDFVYHSDWFMDINYVAHLGPAKPFLTEVNPSATPVQQLTFGQTLSDRNFISFDVHHTF